MRPRAAAVEHVERQEAGQHPVAVHGDAQDRRHALLAQQLPLDGGPVRKRVDARHLHHAVPFELRPEPREVRRRDRLQDGLAGVDAGGAPLVSHAEGRPVGRQVE